MHTTLTLSIDRKIAKIYAKSIKEENVSDRPLGPITRQLAGIIEVNSDKNHKELLADALVEKYL